MMIIVPVRLELILSCFSFLLLFKKKFIVDSSLCNSRNGAAGSQ